jgi:hypothetical protein
VRSINSSRVCRATVESTCLEQRSSEVCVNTLVDTILAQDAQEQVTQPWWSDLYYITVKITWVLGEALMRLLTRFVAANAWVVGGTAVINQY